jgi:GPH family glycoside/pentoside/hexuronide:cation symporter
MLFITQNTFTYLRMADIIIPSLAGILAVWVMWNYNITEKRAKEIRAELVARRGEL